MRRRHRSQAEHRRRKIKKDVEPLHAEKKELWAIVSDFNEVYNKLSTVNDLQSAGLSLAVSNLIIVANSLDQAIIDMTSPAPKYIN